MIFIREVTLSYGHKKLFNEISETIGPRERIALVGSNGSGKTTLLRLLMGEAVPDDGGIEKPDYATVGYLPQDGVHASGGTVREEAGKAFSGVAELKAKLDEAEAKLAELDPEDEEFYDLIDLMGGWETQLSSFEPEKMNSRIEKVLMGMGFSKEDIERPVEEFSGGWQMRIALGKLLCKFLPYLFWTNRPTIWMWSPKTGWNITLKDTRVRSS
jgi:ATP-binding cassette subfamily F protein 3